MIIVIGSIQLFDSCCLLCRWVEFTDKKVAKRVANMLNGEQIGMCFDGNFHLLFQFFFLKNCLYIKIIGVPLKTCKVGSFGQLNFVH